MKNFMQLAMGVNVTPLLHELQIQPELWNFFDIRGQGEHAEADDILLRFNKYNAKWNDAQKMEYVLAEVQVVNYPAFDMLPEAQKLVFGLMGQVKGECLGRVVISRLGAGKKIPLHSDRVKMAEELWPLKEHPAVYYERYHFCLGASPGSVFIAGEEQVQMLPGEVWWVDNSIPHAVVNNGAEDRVHLVVDVRPWKPCCYLPDMG